MEIYFDGVKMGGIQTVECSVEREEPSERFSLLNREASFTMTNVKSNLRLLSKETRQWCKQLKYDGKTYL